MAQTDVFDLEKALENIGGDVEIFQEILSVYFDTVPQIISELHQGVAQNNVEMVNRSAHSLKSSARTVGGMALGYAAEKLEHESLESIPDTIDEHIALLEKLHEQLIALFSSDAIKKRLQSD